VKAYLIDPFARAITEVEHDDTLQDIYKHIEADCIDAVRLDREDTIYIDDNGLYQQPQAFFRVHGFANPLAGKGLVLGTDHEGYSVEPICSIEDVENIISFIDVETAIDMADAADATAAQNELAAKEAGFGYIHVSSADIMKEHDYTDDPAD
jgi:hypothetical protein